MVPLSKVIRIYTDKGVCTPLSNSVPMIIILIALLLRVCYTDIRYRIIENKCVAVIVLVNIFYLYSISQPVNFISAVVVFGIGIIVILTNFIGAGDIKLLSALGLAFPLRELPDFIFLVTVSGLPLILIVFCLHKSSQGKFSKTLPYGVAISSGYLLKLLI
ncbi:flp operon protein B [Tatumella sp. TA1]|nr:flp operon protein B [Tatumella sp. TA1]